MQISFSLLRHFDRLRLWYLLSLCLHCCQKPYRIGLLLKQKKGDFGANLRHADLESRWRLSNTYLYQQQNEHVLIPSRGIFRVWHDKLSGILQTFIYNTHIWRNRGKRPYLRNGLLLLNYNRVCRVPILQWTLFLLDIQGNPANYPLN